MAKSRIFLGVFYPEIAVMQPTAYTVNYDRGECERIGKVWFEGYCFELDRHQVLQIIMKSENVTKEKRVFAVYAITESE